jgi:hypothetical protein
MPILGQKAVPNAEAGVRKHRLAHATGVAFFILVVIARLDLNAAESKSKLTREYDLKAAFLFNFAHFVEWPSAAFEDANTPIVIGVLGDDPFGPVLDKMVEGETIQNRRLIIKRSHQVEDLKNCQVLFISKSEKDRMDEILSQLNPAAVLTVSEVESFARRGGIINFYIADKKVRFEINPQAAKRNGLKISAQLLELGAEVRS